MVNFKLQSETHVSYFVLATLLVVASLVIPDFIPRYWISKAIEIGATVFSAILYTCSVKYYLKKVIKMKAGTGKYEWSGGDADLKKK